jgi:hypothetical protein
LCRAYTSSTTRSPVLHSPHIVLYNTQPLSPLSRVPLVNAAASTSTSIVRYAPSPVNSKTSLLPMVKAVSIEAMRTIAAPPIVKRSYCERDNGVPTNISLLAWFLVHLTTFIPSTYPSKFPLPYSNSVLSLSQSSSTFNHRHGRSCSSLRIASGFDRTQCLPQQGSRVRLFTIRILPQALQGYHHSCSSPGYPVLPS